jgi:hypothetical protein
MNAFVIRCYRAQAHVGKVVRAAIRHHWHVSHTAAHVIYHGSVITCVAVPLIVAGAHFVPSLSAPRAPALAFSPPPLSIPEPAGLPVFAVGVAILLRLRKRS